MTDKEEAIESMKMVLPMLYKTLAEDQSVIEFVKEKYTDFYKEHRERFEQLFRDWKSLIRKAELGSKGNFVVDEGDIVNSLKFWESRAALIKELRNVFDNK